MTKSKGKSLELTFSQTLHANGPVGGERGLCITDHHRSINRSKHMMLPAYLITTIKDKK